jgi:acyl transferase domain-containing protein
LRRASVASFGFGGSNAHAILDDAYHYLESRNYTAAHCSVGNPIEFSQNNCHGIATQDGNLQLVDREEKKSNVDDTIFGANDDSENRKTTSRLFVWSAADEKGISRLVDVYQKYFDKIGSEMSINEDTFLKYLSNTLAFRRSRLSWRAFAIADSLTTLKNLEEVISSPVQPSKALGVGYVFTGQGAQYYRMGVDLIEYDVFTETLHLCEKALQSFGCQWSVLGKSKSTSNGRTYSKH